MKTTCRGTSENHLPAATSKNVLSGSYSKIDTEAIVIATRESFSFHEYDVKSEKVKVLSTLNYEPVLHIWNVRALSSQLGRTRRIVGLLATEMGARRPIRRHCLQEKAKKFLKIPLSIQIASVNSFFACKSRVIMKVLRAAHKSTQYVCRWCLLQLSETKCVEANEVFRSSTSGWL